MMSSGGSVNIGNASGSFANFTKFDNTKVGCPWTKTFASKFWHQFKICQDFVSPSSVLFNSFWFVTISEWFWCHRSFLYFFNNLTFSLHFRLYQFDIFIFQYLFDILSKLADKSTEQVGGRILDGSCFVFWRICQYFDVMLPQSEGENW